MISLFDDGERSYMFILHILSILPGELDTPTSANCNRNVCALALSCKEACKNELLALIGCVYSIIKYK